MIDKSLGPKENEIHVIFSLLFNDLCNTGFSSIQPLCPSL